LERLDIDPFVDCINAAAEFTSNPNVALHLGHKFRVGTFGQTGKLYGSCKNLREVIRMNDRYQKVAIDAGRVEYLEDPSGGHHMCFRPYYSDIEKYRPVTDIIMASYVTTYRWLTWGSGDKILSTRLPYPCPREINVHQEIFQSIVQFESSHTCLEFSESAMSQDITTHDPERLARAQVKLDRILGSQMAFRAFEEAVDAAIKGALQSGEISSHIVAERMGLSWSALRTQLTESGEGIRPRIERIRKSTFIKKFEAGKSFSQIAMCLAYNDQAAMNRAFRRWFDMTPSEWRRQREKDGFNARGPNSDKTGP
jgi:AraC-like DNA-binding protein